MYDLIVVGAGPAGSSSARAASKSGLKVLILEKSQFPRSKACGGAVSERALSYLDFELPVDAYEQRISGTRVHFREQVSEKLRPFPLGVLVSRSVFDSCLLEKARESGAEIHTGTKVLDFAEESSAVTVTTTDGTFEGKFLIVAEGAHGTLKNRVRRKDKPSEFGLCVLTEIPVPESSFTSENDALLDIYFGVARRGYGWVFPHKGYLSVGLGGLATYLRNPRETMMQFLQDRNFDANHPAEFHFVPVGGIKRKIVSSRAVLCGDAAGFVDAFSGEGIAYAIRSGQIAAEGVADALRAGNSCRILTEVEAKCHSEFGSELEKALLLSRLAHFFPKLFLGALTGDKDVLDKYLEVAASRETYGRFLSWLLPRIPRLLVGQLTGLGRSSD